MFDVVKPCKSCKSYVLMPKEKFKLDLEKLKDILKTRKFKIKVYTGSLLSIEKECKINIYTSGKVVILTKREEYVRNINNELSSILYPYTKA